MQGGPVSVPARRRPVRSTLLPCRPRPGCRPRRTGGRRTSVRPGSCGGRRRPSRGTSSSRMSSRPAGSPTSRRRACAGTTCGTPSRSSTAPRASRTSALASETRTGKSGTQCAGHRRGQAVRPARRAARRGAGASSSDVLRGLETDLQRALQPAFDRPAEVGQLVAQQHDLLEHRSLQRRAIVGGRKKRLVIATPVASPGSTGMASENMLQPRLRLRAPGRRSAGAGSATPNVSVTTSERRLDQRADRKVDRDDVPVVAVAGQRLDHQQLRPGRSRPAAARRGRCGRPPAPRTVGAGMPWNVTGAGITVRVTISPGASWPVPMLMSPLRSKEYQSRVPSAYCCAVRVRSPNCVVAEPGREREGVLHPVRLPRLVTRRRLARTARRTRRSRRGRRRRPRPCRRVRSGALGRAEGSRGLPSAARSRRPSSARSGDEVGVGDGLRVERCALRLRSAAARRTACGTPSRSRRWSTCSASSRRKCCPLSTARRSPSSPSAVADCWRGCRSTRVSSGMRRGRTAPASSCVFDGDRAGVVARHRRARGPPARHDRRAGVLALELADLPLPGQQPERVVDARGVADRRCRCPSPAARGATRW